MWETALPELSLQRGVQKHQYKWNSASVSWVTFPGIDKQKCGEEKRIDTGHGHLPPALHSLTIIPIEEKEKRDKIPR